MKIITEDVELFGVRATLNLMDYEISDREKWKILFADWKRLNEGMKDFNARGINIPEGISEVAFCLFSGSKRFVSKLNGKTSASFDTFNLKNMRAEQIKACSVAKDLTSFGPTSKWDDIYFIDFFNNGNINGMFDVYKIPDDLIYNRKVNKKQTFTDQQKKIRRPRFSIKKEIIRPYNLEPIAKQVEVWT